MSSKGLQTKQNIITKSLHLFSVKGYYNTSINDILEATKLTKGGLYGHFKSKEDIWYAVYDEAVNIWKAIVFKDVRTIDDPLKRIETTLDHDLRNYLGADVFEGGCFFLNMLVELSGQSRTMSDCILKGFIDFSKLINNWLKEAHEKNLLKPGLNFNEIASFIVISLNGSAALYASTREPRLWELTLKQLSFYINELKR
ncbi:TetR/AcrR family transcriptional regulator [Desulfobacterales bacterium HSG17]|nr:TetR/AcrR family transcriptional regulator [Desulfobacterales bacterium HSG17]